MSREAILIGHGAPLLITLGRTKVGNHDRNGVSRTCAVTCVLSGKCAQVCQFVALSAATAAPCAAATEQIGTPSSCVDIASTGLPRSRAAATSAATGTFLAIEIMLPSSSAMKIEGCKTILPLLRLLQTYYQCKHRKLLQ